MNALALALAAGISAYLVLSVPWDADPGWWDASRHAMDGAFYLDWLRSGALLDPFGFAAQYYARYPAIAPALYPPAFAVAEALLFAVFGVHAWVSRVSVALFAFAGACGLMRLGRIAFDRNAGLAAGLLYLAMPLMQRWGREIMLEPAATAFLIWSLCFGASFLATSRTRDLLVSVALGVAATYTKQNFVLVLPVLVLALCLAGQGRRVLERRVLLTGVLAALAGVPLVWVTLRYSAATLGQAFSQLEQETLTLWQHVTFHVADLPGTLGWPIFVLALAGLPALWNGLRDRRPGAAILLAWIAAGFLLLAFLLKELRHGMGWLPAFAVLAGGGLTSLLGAVRVPRLRPALACAIPVAVWAAELPHHPPEWCEGIEAPVAWLAEHWDGEAVVLNTEHDGAIVFRMRAADRADFRAYRSSKIFERFMIHKFLGTELQVASERDLRDRLRRYAVRYVLIGHPLPRPSEADHMLRGALRSGFSLAAEFPIRCPQLPEDGPYGQIESSIEIHKLEGPLADPPERPTIHLPVVGIDLKP